jgi:hypothetical protein
VYVLSGGLWYEVEKDYAKVINDWFTSFLGSHATARLERPLRGPP